MAKVDKPAKLTTKQRKLIKGVVEGKTQKQAAIDAGYSEKSAETIASQQLAKEQVKATIQDLMEHMGLSDGALLVKHRELLEAQKQISGVQSKGGNPRDADGGSLEFVDVPDYQIQAKALEMAYKLKGAFTDKAEIKHSGAIGTPELNVIVNGVASGFNAASSTI